MGKVAVGRPYQLVDEDSVKGCCVLPTARVQGKGRQSSDPPAGAILSLLPRQRRSSTAIMVTLLQASRREQVSPQCGAHRHKQDLVPTFSLRKVAGGRQAKACFPFLSPKELIIQALDMSPQFRLLFPPQPDTLLSTLALGVSAPCYN